MTQPAHVPLQPFDRVRPSERLSIAGAWHQDRAAELVDLVPPTGAKFGSAGPDVGYGLKLAKRFGDRLALAPLESLDDVIAGGFACGAKRAATLGRGPSIYDMEWAYTLWGLLGAAPADLVAFRFGLFRGAAHHYWDQRDIVDRVKPEAFRLSPSDVRPRLDDWHALLSS